MSETNAIKLIRPELLGDYQMVEQQSDLLNFVRRSDISIKEFGMLNDIYVPWSVKEGTGKQRGQTDSRAWIEWYNQHMLECKNVFLHWGENKDQLIELIWKYYGETQVCINFPATITVKVKTHTLSPATSSKCNHEEAVRDLFFRH